MSEKGEETDKSKRKLKSRLITRHFTLAHRKKATFSSFLSDKKECRDGRSLLHSSTKDDIP